MMGKRTDVLFADIGLDVRVADAGLCGSLQPRPVVTQIIGIGTREQRPFCATGHAAIKMGLAEETAVDGVRAVPVIGEFTGFDACQLPSFL